MKNTTESNDQGRRKFIKDAAKASAFTIIPSSILGAGIPPSDKINVALIGCRSMGFGNLKNHLSFDDAQCAAMCDVDSNILNERADEVNKSFGQKPALYDDYRKMLEHKDIDAVIIGTPDHWHCLQMVACAEAGKDVYVEKPMANSIEECNIMVNAANYYQRVVQVGQQQRNNKNFLEAMQLIRSGAIGNLRKVNIWYNFNYGLGTDAAMDSTEPPGVNYNMWLGPAPRRPFNVNHFHGTWRHFWPYGGGLFSDWGVHLIDMGLWARDQTTPPTKVMVFAENNSNSEKKRDTFDSMNVVFPMKDFAINVDMTAGVQKGPYDTTYGVSFIGDLATIKVDRHKYRVISEWDNELKANRTEEKEASLGGEAHKAHARNFLDCIKSRDVPACPPEIGRVTAIHVHAANIAARLGENFLIWDDKNNRFTNCDRANNYVAPRYRAPWVLPKKKKAGKG
jgi:predicted dehydrogenase